jgi:hypothetical protein
MQSFSFGEAIASGFRVIARHPLAVPLWALVYLLLVAVPAVAILIHLLPNAIAQVQDAVQHAAADGRPDPARMMALRSQTFGWQPALWLLQVFAHTLVMAAVFRAVLEPQKASWGFLRLGAQELWLGLTYLVLMVMTFIMVMMLLFPMAIASAIVAGVAHHGGNPPVGAALLLTLIGLAGVGAIVWILLRLSMALPMSFAQSRFMLYESWDLTRGQALKLFLVYLVLGLGVLLFEILVVAAAGLTLAPELRSAAWTPTAGLEEIMNVIHRQTAALVSFGVVIALFAMGIHALLIAPLAEVYRELTGGPRPADEPPLTA